MQALVDKSTRPYTASRKDIEGVTTKINAAYEFAAGMPYNQLAAQQWQTLRDPDGTLYGAFLRVWKQEGTIGAGFRKEFKGQLGEAFDYIICLEANKQAPKPCASANAGQGQLNFTLNTIAGQTYYLMISGGDIDDQGVFNLDVSSYNDCDPCLNGSNFVASPPPTNGTYSSDQLVTFCYTVTEWDVTGTIEWLHALEIRMGPPVPAAELRVSIPAARIICLRAGRKYPPMRRISSESL